MISHCDVYPAIKNVNIYISVYIFGFKKTMTRLTKTFLFVLVIMLILFLTQLVDRHYKPTRNSNFIHYPIQDTDNTRATVTTVTTTSEPRHVAKQRIFKILYWTSDTKKGSSDAIDWFGLGSQPFEKCKYKNCVVTNDRAEYNNSDALLVKMRFEDALPAYRFPWQKWVARWHESPANGNYTRYNHIFNATWTYSATKSDIYTYQYMKRFVPMKNGARHEFPLHPKFFKRKTKMAAWFVSHCSVPSRREELVKALQVYIDIDIYGSCGPLKCGVKMDKDCDKMLSSDYKFYLSFENSLCQEYVTEKLWRAYANDIIPVVMGASKYATYLPKHSYIDIGSFGSAKDLADYLILLSRDERLYLEYFQWKASYSIEGFGPKGCAVCSYLNRSANVTKTYERFDQYWDKSKDCVPPDVYYKNLFPSNSWNSV